MSARNNNEIPEEESDPLVSIYPAWCKRCGNCVAFCPVDALEQDEWGYPHLSRPDRCTACHLCEKLCPDFAITVGEPVPGRDTAGEIPGGRPGGTGTPMSLTHSPERVLPTLENHRDDEEADSDQT